MRYIKEYKLFESETKEDISNTIKDICLEISDEGFKVHHHLEFFISIQKESASKHTISFNVEPIKDTLIRLGNYMGTGIEYATIFSHAFPGGRKMSFSKLLEYDKEEPYGVEEISIKIPSLK